MACVHHISPAAKDPNQAAYEALKKDYKLNPATNNISKGTRCIDPDYQQKMKGALAHLQSKVAAGEAISTEDQRLIEPLKKIVAGFSQKTDPTLRDWDLDVAKDRKSISVPGDKWEVARAMTRTVTWLLPCITLVIMTSSPMIVTTAIS